MHTHYTLNIIINQQSTITNIVTVQNFWVMPDKFYAEKKSVLNKIPKNEGEKTTKQYDGGGDAAADNNDGVGGGRERMTTVTVVLLLIIIIINTSATQSNTNFTQPELDHLTTHTQIQHIAHTVN
jgi:hypothetical protein